MSKTAEIKKIKVTPEVFNILEEEFKCSYTTIYSALKFFTQGDNPDKIRERAVQLMEDLSKENKELYFSKVRK